jgi:hypothetical protein
MLFKKYTKWYLPPYLSLVLYCNLYIMYKIYFIMIIIHK